MVGPNKVKKKKLNKDSPFKLSDSKANYKIDRPRFLAKLNIIQS